MLVVKEESWEEFYMHATANNAKQKGSVVFSHLTSDAEIDIQEW